MPVARGAITGFSDFHTRVHIYRSIIEGINFALMDGINEFERRTGMRSKELYLAGGRLAEQRDLPDNGRYVRPSGI